MLSRFFHVQLCATPGTTAHQAPLSMEFSSQEYWSRLPFRKQINKQRKQTNNNNNKLQNLKTKAYESNGWKGKPKKEKSEENESIDMKSLLIEI